MFQFNFGGRSLAAALALLAVAVVTTGADVSVFAPAKAAAPATAWQKTVDGVIVTPASGAARRVRLQVMSDGIIRVTAAPAGNLETPKSLMVVAAPVAGVKMNVLPFSQFVPPRVRSAAVPIVAAVGARLVAEAFTE